MDGLHAAARRLDEAAAAISDAARTVAALGPAGAAFGVDGPGRLGELGRAMYRQWSATLDARAREAVSAAGWLADLAAALRVAAASYADTDIAAGRRQAEER